MKIYTVSFFCTVRNAIFFKKLSLFVLLSLSVNLHSQNVYFTDGYHGGIYGHYPVWKTQFIVDKMNEHPEWKINLEIEAETWDSVRINTPEAYLNFKNMVYDPRIEFTNPTYAQPYCFNISGESIIRQFEYGIKKNLEHFPDLTFETYAVEEPCFTSSLPQILNSFGFKYAVLKNPNTCWGGYMRGYGKDRINWIGPDGSSILTVPRYECEAFEDGSTWQTTAWNNSDVYLKACFDAGIQLPVGMCFQDAGWRNGPWLGFGENIKNNSIYTTWKDYFALFPTNEVSDNWKASQEDVQVALMWGSQVLQRIAQQVRYSENVIVTAEKMLTMANIETGFAIPESLIEEAWRTLLLAQHHDSWIVPYNRLKKNRTWAEEIKLWTDSTNAIAGRIIDQSQSQLVSQKNPATGHYLRIYNTLPEERQEILSVKLPSGLASKDITVWDIHGKQLESIKQQKGEDTYLTCTVSVPAFGYTTLRLKESKSRLTSPKPGITFPTKEECVMENELYKITFDLSHGGKIKSLIAKHLNNKEFVDVNNEFGFTELRGHFYEKQRFISNTEQPAKLTILEDNALKKQVKIESRIDEHPCYQIITLHKSQERIDFSLSIDWKQNEAIGEYKQQKNWHESRRAFYDDRYKLNVLFPSSLTSQKIYKNAPFDVCESQLENTFFNTWDNLKNNLILHWLDVVQGDESYGLALLSDHATSYSHGKDFPLGLTAQYSGSGLWGMDYKITQALQMNYALIPHKGKWEDEFIATKSNLWNEKMLVSFHENIEMQEKSFLRMDKKGYEVTSIKPEGEKDIVMRIFNQESDDKPLKIQFDFPVANCDGIELNGKLINQYVVGKDNSITDRKSIV